MGRRLLIIAVELPAFGRDISTIVALIVVLS
jgi:hypothetical protein